MSKVLLVDDDVELSSMLSEYIAQEGFAADCVHDGEAGVSAALAGGYDIVVLDVMMPRLGGIEALRRIRAQSKVPVLMPDRQGGRCGPDRRVGAGGRRLRAEAVYAAGTRCSACGRSCGGPRRPPPKRSVVAL